MIEMVRCNECWWVGHDDQLELVQCAVDGEVCRGCPHCRTDHHLMDVEVEAGEVKPSEDLEAGDVEQ